MDNNIQDIQRRHTPQANIELVENTKGIYLLSEEQDRLDSVKRYISCVHNLLPMRHTEARAAYEINFYANKLRQAYDWFASARAAEKNGTNRHVTLGFCLSFIDDAIKECY